MCTTNIFTNVYPDGRRETWNEPTLCHFSQYGVPCANNGVFRHPEQRASYPGQPSSMPSPTYLASNFPPTPPSYSPRSNTPNYRSGDDESERSGYRSASSSHGRHGSTGASVYINGRKVYNVERSHRTRRTSTARNDPPTPLTPPQGFVRHSAPASPHAPYHPEYSPRSSTSSRRPVVIQETPARVEIDIRDERQRHQRHSRHSSTSSHDTHRSHDDEEARARAARKNERKERREAEHMNRLHDRVAAANANISQRPSVPTPPQTHSSAFRAEDLAGAFQGLAIDQGRAPRRRSHSREQEAENEAQEQRLRDRMTGRSRRNSARIVDARYP